MVDRNPHRADESKTGGENRGRKSWWDRVFGWFFGGSRGHQQHLDPETGEVEPTETPEDSPTPSPSPTPDDKKKNK